jgi:hypothetical protein
MVASCEEGGSFSGSKSPPPHSPPLDLSSPPPPLTHPLDLDLRDASGG